MTSRQDFEGEKDHVREDEVAGTGPATEQVDESVGPEEDDTNARRSRVAQA